MRKCVCVLEEALAGVCIFETFVCSNQSFIFVWLKIIQHCVMVNLCEGCVLMMGKIKLFSEQGPI